MTGSSPKIGVKISAPGSCEPAKRFLTLAENGGKLRWALTGSNRRHLPCKGSDPKPISHFLANFRQCFASLFRFRPPNEPLSGTWGTTRPLPEREV